jgi:hypothetical protein
MEKVKEKKEQKEGKRSKKNEGGRDTFKIPQVSLSNDIVRYGEIVSLLSRELN